MLWQQLSQQFLESLYFERYWRHWNGNARPLHTLFSQMIKSVTRHYSYKWWKSDPHSWDLSKRRSTTRTPAPTLTSELGQSFIQTVKRITSCWTWKREGFIRIVYVEHSPLLSSVSDVTRGNLWGEVELWTTRSSSLSNSSCRSFIKFIVVSNPTWTNDAQQSGDEMCSTFLTWVQASLRESLTFFPWQKESKHKQITVFIKSLLSSYQRKSLSTATSNQTQQQQPPEVPNRWFLFKIPLLIKTTQICYESHSQATD